MISQPALPSVAPAAQPAASAPPANPYVGPRTFTLDQAALFFGREREARDLLDLVIANRVVLFFAQSGAGKSSLINTRLIPGLQAKGFEVLPVGRVGGEAPTGWQVTNIYTYNLMVTLAQDHADDRRLSDRPLSDFLTSLTWADGRWADGAGGVSETPLHASATPAIAVNPTLIDDPTIAPRVLIIDQFEELLTTHPDQWPQRELFFRALRQALDDDPFLWLALTLREDYVAALSPFAHLLPGGLRARYYMQRMETAAALEAIAQPAALGGRPFAPGVAQVLVDNLRQVRNLGQAQTQLGQFIEPVQLQVVCYQLWEKLRRHAPGPITSHDLQAAGDVDRALANYYEEAIANVLRQPVIPISERQLRDWFDRQLITEAGTRGAVFQGEEETAGMPNAAVRRLADRFLLRTELRAGGAWVELVHDRFVEPIRQTNRAWLQRQSPLLQTAQLWAERGRPPVLLYVGEQLAQANAELASSHPDPLLGEFLATSEAKDQALLAQQKAELAQVQAGAEYKRAEEQSAAAAKLRRLAVFLTLSLLLTIMAGVMAFQQYNAARKALGMAQTLILAAKAVSLRTTSPELAMLLALATAQRQVSTLNASAPEALSALHAQFDQWSYWQRTLFDHGPNVRTVVFGRQDSELFTGSVDGRLLAWQTGTQAGPPQVLLALDQAIDALALHPTQDWLAAGTEQGQIRVVTLQNRSAAPAVWQAYADHVRVLALVFSADGKMLISSGADGVIKFWSSDPLAQKVIQEISIPSQDECGQECWVRTLAISVDGQWLAAGAQNQRLYLWHLTAEQPPVLVLNVKLLGNVRAVAFSHDQVWLAAGDEARFVTLYKLATLRPGATNPSAPFHRLNLAQLSQIYALAFGPDRSLLAIGDSTGIVGTVAIGEQVGEFRVLGNVDAAINALAFSPSGSAVASAVADNEDTAPPDSHVTIWNIAPVNLEPQQLRGHTASVRSLIFHPAALTSQQPPESPTLVSAGEDETVRFWAPDMQLEALAIITETGNRILAAAVSPDGHWLATGGRDSHVRLYSLPYAGSPPLVLDKHNGEIVTVAFSADSKLLATGASDQHILLWSVDHPQQPPQVLDNLQGGLLALAFSADGHWLAAGDDARRVKLWDLTHSPPSASILYTHNDWVWAVAFSPDGSYLASTSADSMIRLTPLQDGLDAQGPIFAHRRRARALVYNPAGDVLASTGDDGIVKLWRPNHLDEGAVELYQHTGIVCALAFSPDGTQVASAGDDNTIQLWTVRLADLQQMACQRAARNLSEQEQKLFFPYNEKRNPCPGLYP